jgi:hypothetical protein
MNALDSPRHPQLQGYAAAHARWMAEHNTQGYMHNEGRNRPWYVRKAEIEAATKLRVEEILTESWLWEAEWSESQLWEAAMKDWRTVGGGHWAIASVAHKFVGWAMAKGSSGRFYFCVIVAD